MNTNESGRSMVEMLGVLAIIGVLSIGGIAGYTTAMNKYRANEISQAVAMTVIQAKVKNAMATYSGTIGALPSSIENVISGISATPNGEDGTFNVDWGSASVGVKKAFCTGSKNVGGYTADSDTCD